MRARAGILASLAAIFIALPADAYVCTKCSHGPCAVSNPPLTLGWLDRCLPYFINRNTNLLSGAEKRALIAQSFRTWSGMINPCTDLDFEDFGYTDAIEGFDNTKPNNNQNVILAIEDASQVGRLPEPRLLAITLSSYSKETGELFDADIIINAAQFRFQDVTDATACLQQANPPYDLRNTLIHEMGHFIGFDHAPEADSTMFASAMPCETSKRNPNAMDKLGLCTIYPAGQPVRTCSPPARGYDDVSAGDPSKFRNQCGRLRGGTGGCSCTTGGPTGAHSGLTGLALLALMMIARRRSTGR